MNTPHPRQGGGIAAACLAGAAVMAACTADPRSGPPYILPNQSDAANQDASGTSFTMDVPCDAAQLLQDQCALCHAGAQAIPPRLDSHADLIAPWGNTGMTAAEASLATMRGTLTIMPPAGVPAEADIALFEAWVNAGSPAGECVGVGGPAVAELVCSSGAYRTAGEDDEDDMYPGGACNNCHQDEGDAPLYAFAGTVYPTVREPDDCIGEGGAIVAFRDADGRVWQVTSRSGSGNFMMDWPASGITFPVTTSVTVGDATLDMIQPLESPADGDCNRCHTQDGAEGAKGRIFTP